MKWIWSDFAALSGAELYAVIALRESVFIVEQDCPYQECDGGDPAAWHLRGVRDDTLVAYLRAFPPDETGDVVIGRVVVGPEARGTGLGAVLMEAGITHARLTFGPTPIKISAQAHLRDFYERLDFAVTGDSYLEDGIPHLPMRR